jgi:ATP-dependent DNA helicase RecG
MDPGTAEALLADLESEQVERKASLSDKDKVCQAICALANDLAGRGETGFVFLGADNRTGKPTGLDVTDRLLLELADARDSGKLQPQPALSIEKVALAGGQVVAVSVLPSASPPVRYDGRVWVRIGPSTRQATAEEERRLTDRRVWGALPFDHQRVTGASMSELDIGYFAREYLPNAVAPDVLEANQRTVHEQLASLRFATPDLQSPTNGGLLVVGLDPLAWLPGAYVQFVRFGGPDLTAPVVDHQSVSGRLAEQAEQLGTLMNINVRTGAEIGPDLRRRDRPDYPPEALRELIYNALMHRNYDGSNAPVRINWFSDRVEIQNPGGLAGHMTLETLESATFYRNPVLAEAMKTLGFVERFGVGIARARKWLADNGNPQPEFECPPEFVQVTVRRAE